MGLISLIVGILVSIGVCVGIFINLLNWINIPVAFLGAILGFVDIVRYKEPGKGRAAGIFGFIICVICLIVAVIRLIIGGGLI